MRPDEECHKALHLIELGLSDSAIGRELGIPRTTIRYWRLAALSGDRDRYRTRSGSRAGGCFHCSGGFVAEEAYAYLLGVYLGNGYLSSHPRGVYRLRISCDARYPGIVNEIATHVVIVRGKDSVGFTNCKGCVEISSYWKHWPCLFPQHGPGRKHERPIQLDSWQRAIVGEHPKALIRGLIHSDGSRHINQVTGHLVSGPKHYRYPRYMFTNASTDILAIFTDALDHLGVHWTRTTVKDVSVARREDVAFLDTFVGPKR